MNKGARHGISELGVSAAVANQLFMRYPIIRVLDTSHVLKNAKGRLLEASKSKKGMQTKVRDLYVNQFIGAANAKVKCLTAIALQLRANEPFLSATALLDHPSMKAGHRESLSALRRLVTHMNGDHLECEIVDCEVARRVEAFVEEFGQEPSAAQCKVFEDEYYARKASEVSKELSIYINDNGDQSMKQLEAYGPLKLSKSSPFIKALYSEINKLEKSNALLQGSLYTKGTCMVENFWTMMIVYSHGKRLNFAQSKKTAMFLRMCYLKRKFGFWWIDSLLREDAGLEASPPTTKAYADAQSKLREQNRVRKATAEYKKQDQNATQMRRAVASSRRISHRAKTYAGMGRCERERGERQVKAIKRGRAGKKCPDCGGNHGRNSPLCMLTSKEAAMFTHAKPKALDLGLVLKRGHKKRRRK